MNATELFDKLRAQYPGRWYRGQLMTFRNRVRLWRDDARARGVEIGRLRCRPSSKPRTRRRADPLESNRAELPQSLEADPDQPSHELLAAFMIRYPGRYDFGHLRTLQRRMKIWRHDAVQQLIIEMCGLTEDVSWYSESSQKSNGRVRQMVGRLGEATRILGGGDCQRDREVGLVALQVKPDKMPEAERETFTA